MRFHKDSDKRFQRPSRIDAPPLRARFAIRRPKTLQQCPFKRHSQRPELPLQEDGIADDSPMITACYEAYLSMEKMLAVFATLRGDDAEDAIV